MKLYHQEGNICFQTELVIQADVSEVWKLLTTTEGLAKWFPELKAEHLASDNMLTFEADGFKAEMAVLVYEEQEHLKLMWDSGEVSFRLKEVHPGETSLAFLERLPLSFPNLYQDLAGWHYELKRLKGAAEKHEVSFTAECIKKKAEEMKQLMAEQKQLSEEKEKL
ncbi:SRPBCC domain-containing protein [Enterococcus sp. BWM-S5]|uniref:SRPBCC domain-containing protein n=1 Tax=Enterococcus larvae TaxID=2794352 RepID=A0ABS4CEC2_9ENTE|nr:SRPBCC domain-containing protein [Enterococcus larvae]MBP1044734.1 SRPBCC domain-containing protein [Enterococcus larvae]